MRSVKSGTEPLYNTLQHLDPVRRLIDPYANRQVFVHGSGSDHGTRGMRLPNKQVSDKRFTGLRKVVGEPSIRSLPLNISFVHIKQLVILYS